MSSIKNKALILIVAVAIIILAGFGFPNETSAAGTKTILFMSTATHIGGNFGGRSGADTFCSSNKPAGLMPANTSNIHALLCVSSGTDEVKTMPSVYGYNSGDPLYWYNTNTGVTVQFASNWADFLDGTISVSPVSGTGVNDNYWSGCQQDGSALWTCTGWTSSNGWLGNCSSDVTTLGTNATSCGFYLRALSQNPTASCKSAGPYCDYPNYCESALCNYTQRLLCVAQYTPPYLMSGYFISTNLLSGVSPAPTSIDSFIYNLSAKPANTGAVVQFSQDNTNWYNSSGVLNASDTLTTGANNNISLSGLHWSGANFYYKVTFTSDGSDTPVLDDITLNYTINVAPSVGSVSLNNGNNISLNANATTLVSAIGTVSDNNGCTDIISVQGKLYRSGVGSSCSLNNNNCYQNTSCATSSCAGTTCNYTCNYNLQFFAEPTDNGTYATAQGWDTQSWVAWVKVTDAASASSTATNTVQTVDVNTLTAINVDPSITYDNLNPGNNMANLTKALNATNTGNVPIYVQLKGNDMTYGATGTIAVTNQRYSTTTNAAWGNGASLIDTYETLKVDMGKPTSSPSISTDIVYWGWAVPLGTPAGTYTGTNYFNAVEMSAVLKALGVSCSSGNECESTYCVDGVCCNNTCTGSTCQTCGTYSSGGAGICGYVNSSSQDPDSECPGSFGTCASTNCSGSGYSCGYLSGQQGCATCLYCIGSSYSCSNAATNWGANLYGCSGSNTRCYGGACRTCSTTKDSILYSDGCSGCAGTGGNACWRDAGDSGQGGVSCDTVCASYGGCIQASWNVLSSDLTVMEQLNYPNTCTGSQGGCDGSPPLWENSYCYYSNGCNQSCSMAPSWRNTLMRSCVCNY